MYFITFIIIGIIVLFLSLFSVKWYQLSKGKKEVYQNIQNTIVKHITDLGSVNNLSVLPLIDFYTENKALKTEAGVSYLIKADDTTILMDLGLNKKKEHPSPLVRNMDTLGISFDDIDCIFISHSHLDHVGGMAEQKNKEFSFTQGYLKIKEIPVYSPVSLSPSKWNPGLKPVVVEHPQKIKKGIASIGSIPRCLFLIGKTLEHSLAINVAGKGIVLIVGCGHQTIERIIDRAKKIFNEPIYAIIGGLHFPVNGGRVMAGPFNLQNIVGSDRMPWDSIGDADVHQAIDVIKEIDPQLVALSPHDSSDWTIAEFKKAFNEKYHDIHVGTELVIQKE